MHKTAVLSNGAVRLGDDALRLGFVPGTPVDVITTSSGSLMIVISDDLDAIDVPYQSVPARHMNLRFQERRKITDGRPQR